MSAPALTEILGYTEDEHVSINHQLPGKAFASDVLPLAKVRPHLQQLPRQADVWFGVNPVQPMASGRGTEDQVTRQAALYADVDIKPGSCPDRQTARAIIADASAIMGTNPSALVNSGNGYHPYWPIEDGQICDTFTTVQAKWSGTEFR